MIPYVATVKPGGSVNFIVAGFHPNRGVYLVICAFVPHFDDEMWGYVRVVR